MKRNYVSIKRAANKAVSQVNRIMKKSDKQLLKEKQKLYANLHPDWTKKQINKEAAASMAFYQKNEGDRYNWVKDLMKDMKKENVSNRESRRLLKSFMSVSPSKDGLSLSNATNFNLGGIDALKNRTEEMKKDTVEQMKKIVEKYVAEVNRKKQNEGLTEEEDLYYGNKIKEMYDKVKEIESASSFNFLNKLLTNGSKKLDGSNFYEFAQWVEEKENIESDRFWYEYIDPDTSEYTNEQILDDIKTYLNEKDVVNSLLEEFK